MIFLKIKNIEKNICLNDNYNFIIIENLDYFYKILNCIKNDIDANFMFYDSNYNQINLEKRVELITDFFNIDCSKSKFFYDFIKINKIKELEAIKEKMNDILLDDLITELQFQSIIELEYEDDIDLEYLLKSMNVKFRTPNNRVDSLIDYCRLIFEIYNKDIIIFSNINAYYNKDEIDMINNQLKLLGIMCINICTNLCNLEENSNFTKIIIDNDLCEFYN